LVAFIGATALTLVPSPLLEFRYFIVPYILLRLHLRPIRRTQVLLEQLLYAAVNAVTIYIFLYRRFRWPTEDGWQRFMW
jgi:alpha-1,2-glucosyltransferase